MRKIKDLKVNLSIEGFNMEDYNDDEFAMAKVCFLSTNQNSHRIEISEQVLRDCAKTVLGKWLVAEYDDFNQDVTTHTNNQQIFGMFPTNQEIEFEEENDVIKASATAIISKIYSTKLYELFEDEDTKKDVSVEMIVTGDELDDGSTIAESFNIVGVTVLGKVLGREIHGSCPDANMSMIRFSEEDANKFYVNFEERRENMAEKTYKINKEELKETAWGDVDKTELRDTVMSAENKSELAHFVYMLVEDGWEDAPSEHLKYPVSELVDDTFYYNRYGLASALAYAKKEGEDEIVEKIEKIYDKFDLEDDEKKEDMAMKEIEFAAVNLSDMWSLLYSAIRSRDNWNYCIDGIYEENGQKFAILKHYEDCELYRIDFTLTEEGVTLAEECVKVGIEFVPTGDTMKFAECENVEQYTTFAKEDDDVKDTDDDEPTEDEPKDNEDDTDDDTDDKDAKLAELEARCEELSALLEEKENIIMEKDACIAELEDYKKEVENKEKLARIDTVMAEVNEYLDNDTYKEFKEEGIACELSELDNWTNKVKAFCFAKVSTDSSVKSFRYTNFSVTTNTEGSVWDRL